MRATDPPRGRLRLRHVETFLAVAKLGGLGRAADALAVTQPAVSKTLAELEEIVGTRLVQRGRRGASLTPEGLVFLRHANAGLNALASAVESAKPGAIARPLLLGALPSTVPSFVPPVLAAFRRDRPREVVRVVTGRNAPLLQQLRGGELDAVVGRLSDPAEMSGLSFEPLYSEPTVIAVRAAHPLRRLGTRGLSRVADYPMVLPPEGTSIRHAADSFFDRHGIVPRAGITESLSASLARGLVRDGNALWFTPLGAARPDLDAGLLVRLPVEVAAEEMVGLFLPAGSVPRASLQAMIEAIRAQAATYTASLRKARSPRR